MARALDAVVLRTFLTRPLPFTEIIRNIPEHRWLPLPNEATEGEFRGL